MAEDLHLYDLATVEAKGNIKLVGTDPSIAPGTPGKQSVITSIANIRAGVKVILDRDTTPLSVQPGNVVFVVTDDDPTPLVAIVPGNMPDLVTAGLDEAIRFIPMGNYSDTPLHIDANGQPVNGDDTVEIIEVTETDVGFDLRWINDSYGFGAYYNGGIVNQNIRTTTITGSDLTDIREVAGTNVVVVDDDRESGVATTSDVAGTITLPKVEDLEPGWQCTVFQLGIGEMTIQTDPTSAYSTLIALSGQTTTMGKGSFVSCIVFPGNKWVIGGGLTNV